MAAAARACHGVDHDARLPHTRGSRGGPWKFDPPLDSAQAGSAWPVTRGDALVDTRAAVAPQDDAGRPGPAAPSPGARAEGVEVARAMFNGHPA